MPLYEYRCRSCDRVFELRRPMADADGLPSCPAGHPDTVKLLSVFAATGRARTGFPATAGECGAPVPGGCGGSCACHAAG